ELAAIPPGVDVDVGLDASLGVGFTGKLNTDLQAGIAADAGITAAVDIGKLNGFSNAALLPIGQSIVAASEIPADKADAAGPHPVASLEFGPGVGVPVK